MGIIHSDMHQVSPGLWQPLPDNALCPANNLRTRIRTGSRTGQHRPELLAKLCRRHPFGTRVLGSELPDALEAEVVLAGPSEPFAKLGPKPG